MKIFVAANGRWFLVGLVLLAVGLLVATGLGQRRGTRCYRWRLGLWVLALSLMGAGGVAGCKGSAPGSEKPGVVAPQVGGEKLDPEDEKKSQVEPAGKPRGGEEDSPSMMLCYQAVATPPEGGVSRRRAGPPMPER